MRRVSPVRMVGTDSVVIALASLVLFDALPLTDLILSPLRLQLKLETASNLG